jgi:hypothetical protein
MEKKTIKRRWLEIAFLGLVLTWAVLSVSAQMPNPANTQARPEVADQRPHAANAHDRVCRAADAGDLTLAQSVMLRARLLYAPQTLVESKNSFAPRDPEVAVDEECLSGFTKDLHRAYGELSMDEVTWLASLSPDLASVVRVKEIEKTGRKAPAHLALPDYGLDEEEEGASCIVHYTLSGTHAAPDAAYAKSVKTYIDAAIKSMCRKDFTKAYAEGYADYTGKIHVYIVQMSANGEWKDISSVSGNKMAGYVLISKDIKANFGKTWKAKLKGVCMHEYFHGVQSSYNAWSDLWFLEATAVWAGCYYGKDWGHVKGYYDAADSIVSQPNGILWSTAYRKYSTSALAFYFHGKFKGVKFFKKFFENSVSENDAITIFNTTLAESTTTFAEQYRQFLPSLYLKKLSPLNSKYLPDVTVAQKYHQYGIDPLTDQVALTGAQFYEMEPAPDIPAGPFIATLEAGATGSPEGMLVRNTSRTPIPFSAGKAGVANFGRSVQRVVLIVTDATYGGKDTANRPYTWSAIVPGVRIPQITAESPITGGQSSPITIEYDLLGLYPSSAFPVTIKVIEKGPDVSDYATGDYNLYNGEGQSITFYFNTSYSTRGNYFFTFEFIVPPDWWGDLPQAKTRSKRCRVRVLPNETLAVQETPGQAPTLTTTL